MKNKIVLGVLALGMTFNAFAADYTLKNLRKNIQIEYFKGKKFEMSSPIVKNYSEVRSIAEYVYKKITGDSLEHKIQILDEDSFQDKKCESSTVSFESCQGFTRGKYVYLKKNNLNIILLHLGHELGHLSKERFSNRAKLNYNEMMVEESKAIAFNILWNMELAPYTGEQMNAANFKPGSPQVYFAAKELIIQIGVKQKQTDFKDIYNQIATRPVQELVDLVRDKYPYRKYEKEQLSKDNPNRVYK